MDTNDEHKNRVADYLFGAFHQGGWMFPVSSAILFALKKPEENDPFGTLGQNTNIFSLETNKTGFTFQECLTVKDLNVFDLELADPVNDEEEKKPFGCLTPDQGKEYVIKAVGKIRLDFSTLSEDPHNQPIVVESNVIDYGSKRIERIMDQRSLWQYIRAC